MRWVSALAPRTIMVSLITDAPAEVPARTPPPPPDLADAGLDRRVADLAADPQLIAARKEHAGRVVQQGQLSRSWVSARSSI
jgi:hypothetical protein